MVSAVDVMEHAWLWPYCDGKLGERMQFGALGSTVHGPVTGGSPRVKEVTVKKALSTISRGPLR